MMKKILLVFFSVTVTCLIAEGVLRAYESLFYGEVTGEELLWRYDPVLGWRFQPNAKAVFSNRHLRIRAPATINSQSLRDNEFSIQKPEGTLRILLLGDSVALGMEVEKEKVIDSVLERLIDSVTPSEVINAGVRGYGTDQSYLFLTREGIGYDPDIVLYIYVPNDDENNITIHKPKRKFGKSYFLLEDGRLSLKGVPVPQTFESFDLWQMSLEEDERSRNEALLEERAFLAEVPDASDPLFLRFKWFLKGKSLLYRRLIPALRQIEVIDRIMVKAGFAYPHPPRPRFTPVSDEARKITEALIRAMKSVCDERGIRFAFTEYAEGIEEAERETKIRSFVEAEDIEYIDAIGPFVRESQGKRKFVFAGDGHWNEKGHQLAALIIFRHLQKIGWIPQ